MRKNKKRNQKRKRKKNRKKKRKKKGKKKKKRWMVKRGKGKESKGGGVVRLMMGIPLPWSGK